MKNNILSQSPKDGAKHYGLDTCVFSDQRYVSDTLLDLALISPRFCGIMVLGGNTCENLISYHERIDG